MFIYIYLHIHVCPYAYVYKATYQMLEWPLYLQSPGTSVEIVVVVHVLVIVLAIVIVTVIANALIVVIIMCIRSLALDAHVRGPPIPGIGRSSSAVAGAVGISEKPP